METQEELEKEIGSIEQEKTLLKPKKVKIVKVEIVEVGKENHKNKKVNCIVKHEDKEETIVISSVAQLKEKNVITSGLWYNLDSEEKIQKGSALANFLERTDSSNLKALEGKEIETVLDGNYLIFKSY